ncbi:hypothetical protein ACSE3M_21540 [Bacillus velezensis]
MWLIKGMSGQSAALCIFLQTRLGIIGPALTGFIADKSGSFSGAFLLAGGLAVLASAAVIRFVRPIIIQTASEDKKIRYLIRKPSKPLRLSCR